MQRSVSEIKQVRFIRQIAAKVEQHIHQKCRQILFRDSRSKLKKYVANSTAQASLTAGGMRRLAANVSA